MKEQYLYDKEMFDYSAGGYCGVYIPTHVMKKLGKLAAQYSSDVKKLLNEHKDELLASEWTLANQMDENGKILKQVTIKYAKKVPSFYDNVTHRISLFKPSQPQHIKELYVVDTHEQAKEIANEILLEELELERPKGIESTEILSPQDGSRRRNQFEPLTRNSQDHPQPQD